MYIYNLFIFIFMFCEFMLMRVYARASVCVSLKMLTCVCL